MIKIAKRDVYADVEGVDRLVAVKGQPVTPAYANLVKGSDLVEQEETVVTAADVSQSVGEPVAGQGRDTMATVVPGPTDYEQAIADSPNIRAEWSNGQLVPVGDGGQIDPAALAKVEGQLAAQATAVGEKVDEVQAFAEAAEKDRTAAEKAQEAAEGALAEAKAVLEQVQAAQQASEGDADKGADKPKGRRS